MDERGAIEDRLAKAESNEAIDKGESNAATDCRREGCLEISERCNPSFVKLAS